MHVLLLIELFLWQLHMAAVLPPGIVEAHQAKLMFFTAETCSHILERLVGHYLLLTDEELALWTQEPESYGEGGCGWLVVGGQSCLCV